MCGRGECAACVNLVHFLLFSVFQCRELRHGDPSLDMAMTVCADSTLSAASGPSLQDSARAHIGNIHKISQMIACTRRSCVFPKLGVGCWHLTSAVLLARWASRS